MTVSLRYYFVDGVTGMRLGQYRLCRVIEQLLHRNPYNGDVFIFMNKSRRVIKIIRYDNEAYILYVKALDRDLKFMKIKGDGPVISEDGSGLQMETPGFVAFLSGQERYKDLTFPRRGVRVICLDKTSESICSPTI